MAITRDQMSALAQVGSGDNVVCTWSTNPAAGSKVLVFVQLSDTVSSVVDNGATPSTFTLDAGTSAAEGCYVYRADNITLPASGSYEVTVSYTPGAATIQAIGQSYLGVQVGGPTATNTDSGTSTSPVTGSASSTSGGALFLGLFTDNSGLNPETIAVTATDWVSIAELDNGSSYWAGGFADFIGPSGSSNTSQGEWSLGDSSSWGGLIAVYDEVGAGSSDAPSWDSSGAWTGILTEDFDGSSLDASVWEPGWFAASGVSSPVNGVSPDNDSANVTVSGSMLNLDLNTYGALVTSNPNNSGTSVGFEFSPPAAIEIRANLPQFGSGVANWCALWTDGQTWPGDGEIDIVESLGSPDDNAYHVHDAANSGGIGGSASLPVPYGWHTFGAYWTSTQVDFYYDGTLVGSESTDGFVGPHYIILVNTYNTTADTTPTTLQVDWVKVWTPGTDLTPTGTGSVSAKKSRVSAFSVPPLNTSSFESGPLAYLPNIRVDAGLITSDPIQGSTSLLLGDAAKGLLDTGTLGTGITWSSVSEYVKSFSVNRSANRNNGPLLQWQAGTCSILLDNSDGRFDPDNLASPYVVDGVSQIDVMVPIRVRAEFGGIDYGVFFGFADGWMPAELTYSGAYAELTLSATDAFKVLANRNLATASITGVGDDTGARVSDLLGRADWFTSGQYSSIDTGNSTLQGTTLGENALSLMQVAVDSELGQLYVDGSGAVTFRSRHALLSDTRSNTVQAVFGDSPGTIHSSGIELNLASVSRGLDDTTLVNDVQATRVDGIIQEAQDAVSVAKYLFPRTISRTDLILQNDSAALSWAQWVLYIGKNGENRFDSIRIDPTADPVNLWPQVLGRKMGDRIQVWHRPPGVATPISKDCFITGITHEWDSTDSKWFTTWTFQDASKYGSFFTLDNSTLGQLDFNALTF